MRRYWGVLAVGLLIIPAVGAETPAETAEAPVRFLATAELFSRAIHTLSSFATTAPILLPVMGDPKPTVSESAVRSAVHGSSASLVTTSAQPAFVIVQDGQTLWEIAQTYGVSVDLLVESNGLSTGDLIRPGQRLTIPGGATDIPRRMALSRSLSSAISIARGFLWPARGRVTSGFGFRQHPIFGTREMHTGIDIGAPTGSPVFAARAGRVTVAGYESGYGRLVVIDHGDGVTTWYSHLSVIAVRVGQLVQYGEPVGQIGSTGFSTGPHLLFEIRVNGRPLDPLKYL